MRKLVIIGGSDAGISAALRAKEVDPLTDVTVIVEDHFPNYSVCGIPFYLSGEVKDWHHLAHRTEEEIRQHGIHLLLGYTAQMIDPLQQKVVAQSKEGDVQEIVYTRLIIATGAEPLRPAISGLETPGVYLLRTMEESFALERHLAEQRPQSVVIIGGGYIGLEMADALTVRGLHVTVVEHGASVLKTVDASLGKLVEDELQRHGVVVETGQKVEQISQTVAGLGVKGSGDVLIQGDLVLVAVGVQPRTALARAAGITTGLRGAIRVNQKMETTLPFVYAAGDCAETRHRLFDQPTYLPLGTTAHKQGRIAGENAVGGTRHFAGSLGTQVVKVFDLAIARTGLNQSEARDAGFNPLTTEAAFWDHKAYYPGAQEVHVHLTGDWRTGLLLGAQMVGPVQAEVAKRIDIFATAIFHGMSVAALSELDLSYTPPLGSPWDLVQMSAQAWVKTKRQPLPIPER